MKEIIKEALSEFSDLEISFFLRDQDYGTNNYELFYGRESKEILTEIFQHPEAMEIYLQPSNEAEIVVLVKNLISSIVIIMNEKSSKVNIPDLSEEQWERILGVMNKDAIVFVSILGKFGNLLKNARALQLESFSNYVLILFKKISTKFNIPELKYDEGFTFGNSGESGLENIKENLNLEAEELKFLESLWES